MESAPAKMVLLQFNQIMEYDWGSGDLQCLISQLRKQEHKKYAELWMGTHPKGQSKLSENLTLKAFLSKQGISEFPFLYKVLCIEKALSIQLHPNKKQAQKLHELQPQIYDDNEKPEMFLTLTDFQCLFGIINQEELDRLFTIEPFASLKSKGTKAIKEIIVELLGFDQALRKKNIDLSLKNIESVFPERKSLMERLHQQFPYDQGILVSCLLKYKTIPPGKCFAIAAGIPHAYIKGSCLEIMKNSDNVVRLGLTPKLKDVPTMLEIMNDEIGIDGLEIKKTQQGYVWNNLVLNPIEAKGENTKEITLANASIGIIFDGTFQCEDLKFKVNKGEVFYIQAGTYQTKGSYLVYFGAFTSDS